MPCLEDVNECFALLADGTRLDDADPLEDVAVGCVHVEGHGSYRVLLGQNSSGDFYCSDVIHGLQEASNMEPFRRPFDAVVALLKLSESLMSRAGLHRYSPVEGDANDPVSIKESPETERLFEAQLFTESDLEALGIEPDTLLPFVFGAQDWARNDRAYSPSEEIVRKPILKSEDGWIIASPTEVTHTIRIYVVSLFSGGMMKMFFDASLTTRHVNLVCDQFLALLGATNLDWNPPSPPPAIAATYSSAAWFDTDKIVHVVVIPANPELYLANSANGMNRITAETIAEFESFQQASIASLLEHFQPASGLTLLIQGSVGEGMMVSLPRSQPRWFANAFPIHQLIQLARTEGFGLVELFRWSRHVSMIGAKGVRLLNVFGAGELFGAWKAWGGVLIPDDLDEGAQRIHILFDGTHTTRWLTEVRQACDEHLVLSPESSRTLSMVRYHRHSFWQSDRIAPVYVPLGHLVFPVRVALIERQTLWWVEAQREDSAAADAHAYELWKCVLNWVERISLSLETKGCILPARIRIVVFIEHLNKPSDSQDDHDSTPIMFGADASRHFVGIRLLRGFMRLAHEPANQAENMLAACLLEALSRLANLSAATMHSVLVEVAGNPDARFFHVAKCFDTNLLPTAGRPLPVVHSFSQMGEVQWEALRASGNLPFSLKAENQTEALELLKRAVDHLWVQTEKLVAQLQFDPLVTRALDGFGQIERRRHEWRLTARSLFAVQPQSDDVGGVIGGKEAELNWASICHRIVVETTMYVKESAGARPVTEEDFGRLLCLIRLLIGHANLRDLLGVGLVAPPVIIRSNGRIDASDAFLDNVASKHVEAFMAGKIAAAVESYEENLGFQEDEESDQQPRPLSEPSLFEKAYEAEFGVSIHQVADVVEALVAYGLENSETVFFMARSDLAEMLRHSAGLDLPAIAAVLAVLTLPRRRAWNKDLGRWNNQDVFPWRYRRALSLLSKPVVPTCRNGVDGYLLSPGLMLRAFEYLERTWRNGRFPQEMIMSAEMKAYAGSIADKAGKRFEKQVAAKLESLGLRTIPGVEMTSLGAVDVRRGYGDVDVLAWWPDQTTLLAIECKNFMFAATIGEMADEIDSFKGVEADYLWKHQRRVDWLSANPGSIERMTGIPAANTSFALMLVTSQPSPLEYHTPPNCPSLVTCSFSSLSECVQRLKNS